MLSKFSESLLSNFKPRLTVAKCFRETLNYFIRPHFMTQVDKQAYFPTVYAHFIDWLVDNSMLKRHDNGRVSIDDSVPSWTFVTGSVANLIFTLTRFEKLYFRQQRFYMKQNVLRCIIYQPLMLIFGISPLTKSFDNSITIQLFNIV